jgi:hypothetical protein
MDIGCEFNAMCLEDYFPELKSIFWSMKAKGLCALLDTCPFPEDVLNLLKPFRNIIAYLRFDIPMWHRIRQESAFSRTGRHAYTVYG